MYIMYMHFLLVINPVYTRPYVFSCVNAKGYTMYYINWTISFLHLLISLFADFVFGALSPLLLVR